MRKGTICYVDQNSGHGIIKDENEQKIQFFLMELQEEIRLNDEISFEIELTARGLAATKIHLANTAELTS
jgi:cold shock CspA family protein